ncbi:MAG TPA: superoxide dismutase family protein [Rhizomicrobium sp.]|nr:superoxide dismutase family protein [Rhizomicrobium sp.]
MRKCLPWAAALFIAGMPAHAATQKAVAKFIDINGREAGTATFTGTRHGTLVEIKVTGLNEGPHGVHIHTSGNCDVKTRFTTAGPHFSFEAKPHGFMAPKGMHAGDLPNGYAAHDGTLQAAFLTNAFALGDGKKSIFDKDGASIIISGRADDYASQPDGRSGDRVACGVIVRTVGPASRGKKKKR